MNRGGLGARSVNLKLQSVLTPPGEKRVERFGSVYTIGDKVMQVENDYTKRNLVYTAITRGRKLVVLIGQKKALAMAVKNDTSRRRYTKLRERLAVRSAAST